MRHADSRLRGRPPLEPLALAAAAFALDRRLPPRCPVARANNAVPNTRSTSPGTYTSAFSDSQDKASPAGETLIDPSAEGGAFSRPGTICRGIVMDPPLRNLRSIASRVSSYRASTTAEGSCARICPRARARVKRSRSFVVTLLPAMELLPCQFQKRRILCDQSLRPFHVAVGDPAHNLGRASGRQVDRHDRASFLDMHMRRRMIEGEILTSNPSSRIRVGTGQ
jgi:hypothetical protein